VAGRAALLRVVWAVEMNAVFFQPSALQSGGHPEEGPRKPVSCEGVRVRCGKPTCRCNRDLRHGYGKPRLKLTLGRELAELERRKTIAAPGVHPAWIQARMARLDELLRTDPSRAKMEIRKHLDGALVVTPLPGETKMRRAQITGRVNADGLLNNDQEAVRLELVAGVKFEPTTFGF
jgi:hypothetical protein